MSLVDVSFIVAAQLSGKTLQKTLHSIQKQKTSLSFEIIVIVQLSDNLDPLWDHMKVIKAPLFGASHARNVGIKNAQSETLAFVDGDTVLDELWLETLYRSLASGNWSAAQGRIVTKGSTPGTLFYEFRELSSKVHHDCLRLADYPYPVINSAACLYRRDAVQSFAEDIGAAEDVELSWRILHEDVRGFVYDDRAVSWCTYQPEDYLSFLRRNFKVGNCLKLISARYGESFQNFFYKRMKADFRWELMLLSEKLSIPLLMRLLATAATLLGFILQRRGLFGSVKASESSILVNGKKSSPDERIVLRKDLRTLNLKSHVSKYYQDFEIINGDHGSKMVIRKSL